MRISKISNTTINNPQKNFKALRGVEYFGSFNPGIKPLDLNVVKAMQESKSISKFCQKYNVVIYLGKECSMGEYKSTLAFRYNKIAKGFKEKVINMLTPAKELNLIYKSKDSSAEHSQMFVQMIKELKYAELDDMSSFASKSL